ncbi:MAG TPA: hypothetical protein VKP11_01255 [Frankiaceae bacterium]|nr:hypothetical protein [Frankiaceae bacterium]
MYKRADGSWAAALDLGVVEGKRRRRFVYGRTQKEVWTSWRYCAGSRPRGRG